MSRDQRIDQSATSYCVCKFKTTVRGATYLMTSHVSSALWTFTNFKKTLFFKHVFTDKKSPLIFFIIIVCIPVLETRQPNKLYLSISQIYLRGYQMLIAKVSCIVGYLWLWLWLWFSKRNSHQEEGQKKAKT